MLRRVFGAFKRIVINPHLQNSTRYFTFDKKVHRTITRLFSAQSDKIRVYSDNKTYELMFEFSSKISDMMRLYGHKDSEIVELADKYIINIIAERLKVIENDVDLDAFIRELRELNKSRMNSAKLTCEQYFIYTCVHNMICDLSNSVDRYMSFRDMCTYPENHLIILLKDPKRIENHEYYENLKKCCDYKFSKV